MHAFSQKPKAYQPARTNKTKRSGQTNSGRSGEVHSTLQPHDEHIKDTPAVPPLSRLGHDVSRISIFPSAGDEYKREADLVAEQVMRMPEPVMRRQSAAGNAEDSLCRGGEKAPIQTKQADGLTPKASPILAAQNHFAGGGGVPLPQSMRDSFEPRFGHDFSQVRVHADTRAAEAAQAINARAFTIGRDVVFGRGQFAPQTNSGRILLAHELTHVIQQQGGNQAISVGREQLPHIHAAPMSAQRSFECDTGMPITHKWGIFVTGQLTDLLSYAERGEWSASFDLAEEIASSIFDVFDCLNGVGLSTDSDLSVVREEITQQVLNPLTAATSVIWNFREGVTDSGDTFSSSQFVLSKLRQSHAGSVRLQGRLDQLEIIFTEPDRPAPNNRSR
jgi:hypothetical protein